MARDNDTPSGQNEDPQSMSNRGRFITVEGPDGAGKTTNLDYLQERLQAHGKNVVVTREPGGTALGERIRAMLLDEHSLDISARAETLLIFAARAQHLECVIEPALNEQKWVLCDRFTDATYAYQGGGRRLGTASISALEHWVHPTIKPDLTFIFDIEIAVARQRLQQQGQGNDRFESADDEFKERVRAVYADLAAREPERVFIIDTDVPRARVQGEIDRILSLHKDWF